MASLNKKIELVRKAIKKLDKVFEKTVKDNAHILIDYVVEDQQYERGIGGTGQSLGEYSPVTIQLKKIKGQKTSHVTGRNTKRMHETTDLFYKKDSFSIEHAGEDYMDEFENRYRDEKPFNINEENKEDFKIHYIKDEIHKIINEC